MADDATNNFSPPLKKARYGDEADDLSHQPTGENTLTDEGQNNDKPELRQISCERNEIVGIHKEEEGERQITNGEEVGTITSVNSLCFT